MKVLLIFVSSLAAVYGNMVGGWASQDEKDPQWWEMLANLKSPHKELTSTNFNLESVKSQVVSGVNYELTLKERKSGKTCVIQIWEQAWLNKTTVTKDTCGSLLESKRQELGGVQPVTDFTEKGLQICLGAMLDSINAGENGMYRLVESQIISATRQVVAGWMYGFKIEVAPSDCLKSTESLGKTSTDCAVSSNNLDNRAVYSGRCWYRDWMDPQTEVSDLQRSTDVIIPGQSNPEPDVQNNNANLLGGDTHDQIPHGYNILGSLPSKPLTIEVISGNDDILGKDDHDRVIHGKKLIGGDDHDLINHGRKLIGGDDHDLIDHGKKLIGGDDHDLIDHGKKLIGGDDHDLVDHGKKLIGGDDHDLVDHGKKLIGGDDHDLIDHGKKLIGGDDHDLVEHGKKLIGGDGHDLVNRLKNLIGGDDHDVKDHVKKLLGADDHDLVEHGKKLLGGDGHDLVDHVSKLLGGDDHDYVNHVRKLMGDVKQGYVQHVSRQVLGKDDHDKVSHGKANSTKKLIGGDDHDLCHYGMFKEFQMRFQRQYGYGEEEKRFSIFCDNMRKARKLQETEQGSAIYGATKFADLTEEEFRQYVGKKWDLSANQWMRRADIPKGPIPESFDWREHGAVTPVKNQGSCGSCWAFSTTGNIEGQWAIKKGKLISLSEQELVDCDKVDEGCNGGLPSNAYKEIERLGGLETEEEYSYKGEYEKCQFKKQDVKAYINDSVSISSNETEIAAWLAANGPISIGINAFAMQFYMGGISHPWRIFCNPKSLDHGVLIVGYGVKDSEPYWIIKNSWGENWGEKGYYLVYRGDGVCGLNTMCTSAVVD